MMHLSNKQQRQIVRVVHLLIGSALGFLVYAPPNLTEGLRLFMQVAVFPSVGLSGMWLWYGTRLSKWLRQHFNSGATPTLPTTYQPGQER